MTPKLGVRETGCRPKVADFVALDADNHLYINNDVLASIQTLTQASSKSTPGKPGDPAKYQVPGPGQVPGYGLIIGYSEGGLCDTTMSAKELRPDRVKFTSNDKLSSGQIIRRTEKTQ